MPYIEGNVKIGPHCVIRPGAYLYGPLTMGPGNTVFTGAILGEKPQHLRYNDEPTSLEIGEDNIFREYVTIHRGTTHHMKTVIGNNNFFMVNSHVGHDSVVGNRNIVANGALVAGHCVIQDNVYLSGNCAVHQFVRVGRLALLSGCAITTKDMPPFVMQQGIDNVVGLNLVGMRRSGHDARPDQWRSQSVSHPISRRPPAHRCHGAHRQRTRTHRSVTELLTFLRQPGRGINPMRDRHEPEQEMAA